MCERRATTYNLHGLRVRSEVRLPAAVLEGSECDLDVRWSQKAANAGGRPAVGQVIAGLTLDNGAGYVLTRSGAGWRLRFHGVGEFRFNAPLTCARIHLVPGANRSIVPLLLTGHVAALVLGLTGACVLHASAIEIDGEGFGFLGASGMGKSTLAALCCASEARLITDDTLRLEPSADRFRCIRGPAEIRLRERGATLAKQFDPGAGQVTVDGRLAIRVEGAIHDSVPLRLLAIPFPSRDCRQIAVERLNRTEALYALTRYARVLGWRAHEMIARQFTRHGVVAAKVPVFQMTVPWGSPFHSELGGAVIDKLRTLASAGHVA